MTDQCKHCIYKGNITECLQADCWHHENWYAVEQQKKIDYLETYIKNVTNDLGGITYSFDGRERMLEILSSHKLENVKELLK